VLVKREAVGHDQDGAAACDETANLVVFHARVHGKNFRHRFPRWPFVESGLLIFCSDFWANFTFVIEKIEKKVEKIGIKIIKLKKG
jgi:hypothetical protein